MNVWSSRLGATSMDIVLCVGFAAEAAPNNLGIARLCSRPAWLTTKSFAAGIETAALHTCMDKNGHSLTKTGLNALIDAGEVSQAEVDRQSRGFNSSRCSPCSRSYSRSARPCAAVERFPKTDKGPYVL